MRPKGLWATFLALCVMNVSGFAFLDSQAAHFSGQVTFMILVVVASFVVLWFYWKGCNWARILVLLGSILALLNLLGFASLSSMQRIIVIAEAAFGAFLLWWLNTQPVRDYFKGRNS